GRACRGLPGAMRFQVTINRRPRRPLRRAAAVVLHAIRDGDTMTLAVPDMQDDTPGGARPTPDAAEVHAALARILASDTFRASPQLGVFLRYVVEAALTGRGASLKGYTVGVEA